MHVRSLSRLVAITCYQKNGALRAKTDSKIKRCEETKGGGVGIVGTAGGGDRGVRCCRDGVAGNAGATTKSSADGTRGEKIISVRLTVAVFDGRWGEESCDVFAASDAPSSSTAMVDEEPHVSAGSSVGTRLFSTRATLPIGAGSGVGLAVALLPHDWRQVITDDGHPPFRTGRSA